ncbi:hypothetical protein ACIA5A_05960 [Micromonospora sp. NPDC051300]|uniref:VG15 protein n=1 Tax=Micromonospora sp. NPDC051300 TaxID=3364286 RepID=UPI00379F1C6D
MATPADVAAYRSSQQDVVALARRELTVWWAMLDVSDARGVAAALEVFLSELVAAYGDMAMTVAADWYDEQRDQARVRGSFRASLAAALPGEQVRAVARWAAGPLFGPTNSAKALGLASGAVQRLVQQGGRDTLRRNVLDDPAEPRWARMPQGDETCAWCRMLASRGAVYLDRESAGGDDNTWHNDCDCQPVPVWRGQALPYDADRYLQEYVDARAKAGGDPKAIAAQMRDDLGVN